MLMKMRWRFIGAAMAAFTAVLAAVLLGINVWNYQSVTQQQDNMLQQILLAEQRGQPLPGDGSPAGESAGKEEKGTGDEKSSSDEKNPKGMGQFSQEVRYMLRFFSVRYDPDGKVTKINHAFVASIDEEEAAEYAGRVLSGGKSCGYYAGYRYLVTTAAAAAENDAAGGSVSDTGENDGSGEQETVVILLNSEKELHGIFSILLITSAIAAGCLAVVFILVVLFSKRAILPYVRNIEIQKQFITNAGHELKTPLTAISTSADVLAMEYGEDEWVQNIRQQSAKMTRLIAGLVTLSRLDEENPFPDRQVFSLSDAVWETSESFSAVARAEGKSYIREIADDVVMTGDAVAIQQTVSILLDNAMKYSSERGSIALCLGKSGKKITIAVSNTCDPEEKPDVSRMFDRFYRGRGARTGKVKGTGIGLAVARATVEAHGGSIQAAWDPEGVITLRVTF